MIGFDLSYSPGQRGARTVKVTDSSFDSKKSNFGPVSETHWIWLCWLEEHALSLSVDEDPPGYDSQSPCGSRWEPVVCDHVTMTCTITWPWVEVLSRVYWWGWLYHMFPGPILSYTTSLTIQYSYPFPEVMDFFNPSFLRIYCVNSQVSGDMISFPTIRCILQTTDCSSNSGPDQIKGDDRDDDQFSENQRRYDRCACAQVRVIQISPGYILLMVWSGDYQTSSRIENVNHGTSSTLSFCGTIEKVKVVKPLPKKYPSPFRHNLLLRRRQEIALKPIRFPLQGSIYTMEKQNSKRGTSASQMLSLVPYLQIFVLLAILLEGVPRTRAQTQRTDLPDNGLRFLPGNKSIATSSSFELKSREETQGNQPFLKAGLAIATILLILCGATLVFFSNRRKRRDAEILRNATWSTSHSSSEKNSKTAYVTRSAHLSYPPKNPASKLHPQEYFSLGNPPYHTTSDVKGPIDRHHDSSPTKASSLCHSIASHSANPSIESLKPLINLRKSIIPASRRPEKSSAPIPELSGPPPIPPLPIRPFSSATCSVKPMQLSVEIPHQRKSIKSNTASISAIPDLPETASLQLEFDLSWISIGDGN